MSGTLKEVRERIKSVNNTKQITKAMKMVSAAKLRRAQQAIVEMRPYSDKLDEMLKNILSNLDSGEGSVFGKVREINKVLMVVVTSSRGLCGAFNSNIIKAAISKIDVAYAEQRAAGNLSIMCIGKKGYDFFRKNYTDCQVINTHVDLFNDLSFQNVALVVDEIMDAFEDETYDHIDVAYGHFKNAATQISTQVQFIPVKKVDKIAVDSKAKVSKADYIFEPGKEELLAQLVPDILRTSFLKFCLDTHASEHGARMTAMDKATDNADELLKELKINYNKARQEAITNELSEIVGGAAALGG